MRRYAITTALLAMACGGSQGPAPAEPAAPAETTDHQTLADAHRAAGDASPAPGLRGAEVIAVVDLPSGQDLGTLPRLFTMLAPQYPTMFQGSAVADMVLATALGPGPHPWWDPAHPMRLVLLNPKRFSSGLVVVAGVADAAALRSRSEAKERFLIHGDVAFLGAGAALAALAPADLSELSNTLAGRREPELTVHMDRIAGIYRDELDAFEAALIEASESDEEDAPAGKDQLLDRLVKQHAVQVVMALLRECERVTIRPEVYGEIGRIDIKLSYRASGRVAAFARSQVPSDFALLHKLPPAHAIGFAGAAQLRAGPLYDAIDEILTAAARADAGQAAERSMRAWAMQMTGAMAWTTGPERTPRVILLEVQDGDAARKHGLAFSARQRDIVHTPKAFEHDGVAVAHDRPKPNAKPTPDSAPEGPPGAKPERDDDASGESMHTGFDTYYLTVMGPHPEAPIRAAIDAARGKGARFTPDRGMQAALERSRARRDSVFMFADVAEVFAQVETPPPNARAVAAGVAFGKSSISLSLELLQ